MDMRLEESGPARLTVKELKAKLSSFGIQFPSDLRKQGLIDLLSEARDPAPVFVSSEEAAVEKAMAGESLAVEHIAELGPGQAREARARAQSGSTTRKRPAVVTPPRRKRRGKLN